MGHCCIGKLEAGLLEGDILHDWLGVHICLSLIDPKLEAGTKISNQVIKSWPFGDSYYRSHCLAFWIVPRDSSLISYKSDLTAGWLSELFSVAMESVFWAGCGSEFYFYVWSSRCPFVYLVSQKSISTYLLNKCARRHTWFFLHTTLQSRC